MLAAKAFIFPPSVTCHIWLGSVVLPSGRPCNNTFISPHKVSKLYTQHITTMYIIFVSQHFSVTSSPWLSFTLHFLHCSLYTFPFSLYLTLSLYQYLCFFLCHSLPFTFISLCLYLYLSTILFSLFLTLFLYLCITLYLCLSLSPFASPPLVSLAISLTLVPLSLYFSLLSSLFLAQLQFLSTSVPLSLFHFTSFLPWYISHSLSWYVFLQLFIPLFLISYFYLPLPLVLYLSLFSCSLAHMLTLLCAWDSLHLKVLFWVFCSKTWKQTHGI